MVVRNDVGLLLGPPFGERDMMTEWVGDHDRGGRWDGESVGCAC